MLMNIWVKDNCTGSVHQVGTDPHDSLECWNGVVEYVNMQCMEGTIGGGYSFVESPDLDDYVIVTPEQLMLNRKMLHADLAAMIADNPELMPHTDKYDAIFEEESE
jgi:hypothetical protein